MLSPRLLAITEMIIKGEVTADIGADHGALCRRLVENNMVPRVIASEMGDGPYQRLQACLKDSPCRGRIEVRQGDGLTVLEPGEAVNVVVAGLGGEVMAEILARDWQKAETFQRFVFQPMTRPGALRKELCQRGWPIVEERLIEENSHLYLALSTCPGSTPYKLSPLEIDVGPLLLRGEDVNRLRYLQAYLRKYQVASQGIVKAKDIKELAVLGAYKNKIRELEDILSGGKS